MKQLIDKTYLIIYWVINRKLNPQKTTIWALNYLLFPVLSGFIIFTFSFLLWIISFKVNLLVLIIFGFFISFFLSEKMIDKYFTLEKQTKIINNNKKPGFYRYLIFLVLVLLSLFCIVFFSLLAGIFLRD